MPRCTCHAVVTNHRGGTRGARSRPAAMALLCSGPTLDPAHPAGKAGPGGASATQQVADVVVGEEPAGVEAVAHGEELPEARVERGQALRAQGVHLAPVRTAGVLGDDRLEGGEE